MLAIIIFYDTRADKKSYRVLSCVIYTVIKNIYLLIIFFFNKKISEIPVGYGRGSKHGNKRFDRILGIGIPYLLMNLMSCHGCLKNINYVIILKCPKRMLEYYFPKGFTILECNNNNLEKLSNDVKQRTHAEETYNPEKFMTCINTIPSTSNTLKNLVVNKILHSSYIQTEFNDKKKITINIFSEYVHGREVTAGRPLKMNGK